MLILDKVSSGYNHIPVIHNVSLHVDKSEIVAVVGPNGAGKSTILKTIFGSLRLISGSITFNGERIDNKKSAMIRRKGISYVQQGRRVFRTMSVKENLELGALFVKDKNDLAQKFERVYNLFPVLQHKEKDLAGSLSGGEQQMLAIGTVLTSNPTLILVDEPSLGLSPILVEKVLQIFQILSNIGISLLIVEQKAFHVFEIASKVYLVQQGQIVLEGSPEELQMNREFKRSYMGRYS